MKQQKMKSFLATAFFLCCVVLFSACNCNKPESEVQLQPRIHRDVSEIKKEGTLRVLTTYSSTSYFLYRARPMGFEYDLLKRFAEQFGVKLEIHISKNLDSMFYQLNNGDVDLIAHGLTVTSERKKKVRFTNYLYLTHQVLVQKKPGNWRQISWGELQRSLVHDAIDLIGDTVSVRANSAYLERLNNLSKEIGGKIYIDTLKGNLSTDKIIKMVVDGDIKYTVADNNIASINASYFPELNIEVPISFSQRIAWAVRKNSPELADSINSWLKEMKNETEYYVIYNKYFKNKRNFRKRVKSEFYSLNNDKISPYDPVIKKVSEKIGWDWRLLSSVVYQESRFHKDAGSWAGAEGLMQLMPETAEALGVDDRTDPQDNLDGAVKYLKKIWNRFDSVKDSVERIKFTLAAYNCGTGHVLDAQRLAKSEGLKDDVWDDNVAEALLDLSYPENYNKPVVKYGYVRGIEPYTYVEQIFERYDHYKQFIEEPNLAGTAQIN